MVDKHFKGVEGALYKTAAGGSLHFLAEPRTATALGPDLTRAYQDLGDTLAAQNGPEVVLPYTEDTLGDTPTGYGSKWGTHGGLSWGVQHIPLILSGPGVRRAVSTFPAQLVDVAPTIERLMGLGVPPGVDGVVLSDAVRVPQEGDAASQRAVQSRRMADVTALRLHSLAQHGIRLSNQ
jgi:arylsulfatase A-like enzyme